MQKHDPRLSPNHGLQGLQPPLVPRCGFQARLRSALAESKAHETLAPTSSDSEAGARSNDFWAAMRDDVDAGEFWADRIKQYRAEAQARLQLALKNLPLPAAFREASVALRSFIRTKQKEKQPYEEELAFLYWLAAICSFPIPYSAKLKEPGFNVIESMPGTVIRNLPFEYCVLGYEKLELLNATDKKWIIEIWGEPERHSTLHELHRSVWDTYEDKLLKTRHGQSIFG